MLAAGAVGLLLATLPALSPAAAPHPPDPAVAAIVKNVRRALNRIKPFRVDFVQQVLTDGDMDIEESGDILFKDERNIRWTYLEPDEKIFLLQGEDYKFYDRENEQLTVGKLEEKNRRWIWQLFFSDDLLPHTTADTSRRILTIHKKDETGDLDIQVFLDARSLPVRMIQTDPGSGARMIYFFKNYRENVPVPPDTFRLEVPDDVEIING